MMPIETNYLIVRYSPAIGALIRKILTKNQRLVVPAAGKIRQWQDGNGICRVITLARPDTDDEGAITSFGHSVDDMIRQLEKDGASVEAREKVA